MDLDVGTAGLLPGAAVRWPASAAAVEEDSRCLGRAGAGGDGEHQGPVGKGSRKHGGVGCREHTPPSKDPGKQAG